MSWQSKAGEGIDRAAAAQGLVSKTEDPLLRVRGGEIDDAARVVGDAAGLAAKTRSARLVKELRTTRTQMQPWQDVQAVKILDDQLAAYGLASRSTTSTGDVELY